MELVLAKTPLKVGDKSSLGWIGVFGNQVLCVFIDQNVLIQEILVRISILGAFCFWVQRRSCQ